ncbi:MAG: hypothetical protein ILA06_04395 [Bacteroidaceae bacterium]|nr:hypothetical protein [Bacteroidaceae bacterium]
MPMHSRLLLLCFQPVNQCAQPLFHSLGNLYLLPLCRIGHGGPAWRVMNLFHRRNNC